MENNEPKELGLIHFCDAGRFLFETYADLVDDDDHAQGDPKTLDAWNAWNGHKESCARCGYS